MRIVTGQTFAFHELHLVHSGFFVAGVADLFFGNRQRDRRFTVHNIHDVAHGACISEVEVDGLPFGLLNVA